METDARIVPISFKKLDKLTACQRKELALAAGDKLQLKANGVHHDQQQTRQRIPRAAPAAKPKGGADAN